MGFVKTPEELHSLSRGNTEFKGTEMLMMLWETKPEIIQRLLPPPLKPTSRPIAGAFLAYYPHWSFGPSYYEGALFLRAEFGGIEGNYNLAMPVTGDMAMSRGRERMGFPKKMANIEFKRSGEYIEGSIERHGLRFFQVRARMNGKTNTKEFPELITKGSPEGNVSYNFKHSLAPEGYGLVGNFDLNPRLVRQRVTMKPSVAEFGEIEITMSPSEQDPWSEVEVVRMLGGVYLKGDNALLEGEVVAEVDPVAFQPYSLLKWDTWPASKK
jgi:acetoacetate decarboxylase